MNPHSKPRPLFFTPRTPWGRLPQKHAHQSHMRASEDKKPDTGEAPSVRFRCAGLVWLAPEHCSVA